MNFIATGTHVFHVFVPRIYLEVWLCGGQIWSNPFRGFEPSDLSKETEGGLDGNSSPAGTIDLGKLYSYKDFDFHQ